MQFLKTNTKNNHLLAAYILALGFIFFAFQIKGYSQERIAEFEKLSKVKYIAEYTKTYQLDSNRVAKPQTAPMLLLVGENESQFIGKHQHYNDSILAGIIPSDNQQATFSLIMEQIIPTKINYRINKFFDDSEIVYNEHVSGESGVNYLYKESTEVFNWTIDNTENKEIMGFNLVKASTQYGGRNWHAWFSPDIAINDGPYKFCGLPGLIVWVYDEERFYEFKMTDFYKPQYEAYVKINAGRYTLVNLKEFIKIKQKAPLQMLTRFSDVDPQVRKQMQNNISKRNNNPIELTP